MQSGCEGRGKREKFACFQTFGLKKKNVLVEKMTGVASCSWRTLAVFMRAALESYFMIKGRHAKISSLLVASLKKTHRKQSSI